MTMHLMSPAYTTSSTRRRKVKMTKANVAKWEVELRKYNKLMKRLGSAKLTLEEYIDTVHGKVKPKKKFKPYEPDTSIYVRDADHRDKYPSLGDGFGPRGAVAAPRERNEYTGTLIKGIATMHKSNAVPITNGEQAREIARMRRG